VCEPKGGLADVPCHALPSPAGWRGNQQGTEDPSSRSAPTPRGSEPETSSTDGSAGRQPAYSASIFPEAATATPALPPVCSFQLAFTRTRCALGPTVCGYSPLAPGPRGVHRLLQPKRSVSTPTDGPNSNTYAEACFCRSEDAARESRAHQASTGQGPRAFRSRFWHPPGRPLASVDLPQPDRPEHPLSRTRATRGVENATRNAHAVTWALSNESAWHIARKAQRTVRVLACTPSRKKRTREGTPGAFRR
jgi:hypothetical protein